MGLEGVRDKKLLYHLTKVDNMEMIINHGLLPRRRLIEQKMLFGDVADQQIISKRQELGLDIYSPFHFHPYSAFMCRMRKHSDMSKNFFRIKEFQSSLRM